MIINLVILTLTFHWSGCSSEPEIVDEKTPDAITLVTSLNGAGDNGYNDLILSGVLKFYQEHEDVTLSLVWPHDMKEAESFLTSWMNKESDERHLLIL